MGKKSVETTPAQRVELAIAELTAADPGGAEVHALQALATLGNEAACGSALHCSATVVIERIGTILQRVASTPTEDLSADDVACIASSSCLLGVFANHPPLGSLAGDDLIEPLLELVSPPNGQPTWSLETSPASRLELAQQACLCIAAVVADAYAAAKLRAHGVLARLFSLLSTDLAAKVAFLR
eukprot:2878308-Pleurochrysis_carterae.AAC.4